VARRGTQEDDEPDGTLVVDLEKYSIPDGTRCVSEVLSICKIYCFAFSQRFGRYRYFPRRNDLCSKHPTVLKFINFHICHLCV